MTSWRSEVDGSWTGRWTVPPLLDGPVGAEQRQAVVDLSLAGAGPAAIARSLAQAASWDDVRVPLVEPARRAFLAEGGMRVLLPSDDDYPARLRHTDSPPLLLYALGATDACSAPSVAVVGARVCSSGGARFAGRIGEALAAAGFTVVSGLARGIDAAAHTGALRAGRTVAVLGCGLDAVYPREHARLASEIASSGCLLGEFPPGTEPRAWHFPARNRIIAGLSNAVVVVEAGLRSGALITADFALDYGRELFACTVPPLSPSGAGVRALLADGARLVADADQLVDDVRAVAEAAGEPLLRAEAGSSASAGAQSAGAPADQLGRAILAAVLEQTSVDDVASTTGLPVHIVAARLTALAIAGAIVDEGAGRFTRLR